MMNQCELVNGRGEYPAHGRIYSNRSLMLETLPLNNLQNLFNIRAHFQLSIQHKRK